jgi:hypothetical protein
VAGRHSLETRALRKFAEYRARHSSRRTRNIALVAAAAVAVVGTAMSFAQAMPQAANSADQNPGDPQVRETTQPVSRSTRPAPKPSPTGAAKKTRTVVIRTSTDRSQHRHNHDHGQHENDER